MEKTTLICDVSGEAFDSHPDAIRVTIRKNGQSVSWDLSPAWGPVALGMFQHLFAALAARHGEPPPVRTFEVIDRETGLRRALPLPDTLAQQQLKGFADGLADAMGVPTPPAAPKAVAAPTQPAEPAQPEDPSEPQLPTVPGAQ